VGKSRDGIRGRVLVGVVVPNVGTPLLPGLRLGRGLALELRESRNIGWGSVLVGVVVSDVGTPLLPGLGFRGRLGFTLRVLPRSGGVVTDSLTPLAPSLRFALGRNSVGIVVGGVEGFFRSFHLYQRRGRGGFFHLGRGLRLALVVQPRAWKTRDLVGRSVLVGIVVPDVRAPFRPSYGRNQGQIVMR
jgi:hypothetical protein